MIIEIKSRETISDFLRCTGRRISSDCLQHKGCGKCRVKLLSGVWESNGKTLHAPASATACVTKLKSTIGVIELPDLPSAAGTPVLKEWTSSRAPLPFSDAPVIAVDMGTTTLAAVRIEKGTLLSSVSAVNGQCAFGDNIITRISRAEKDFSALREALMSSIEKLLEELDHKSAKAIGVAGNTVISSFLHGISPASIGHYPFAAARKIFPRRSDLWGSIPVVTVPALSGLIGGDLTGALYEVPLAPGEMLLDLGTNCEILFRTPEGLFGTSAAAGPAFEGAGITSGSRAMRGAIDHYRAPGSFTVIGDTPPNSLCGSGLVDFLASERARGNLSRFGRFTTGKKSVEIAPGVTVSESDIVELLKAKAAVSSAVKALEGHCGTKVRKLKLAGAFARFLDPDSAGRIGLFPAAEIELCGNLSLAGAARAVLDRGALCEMEEYAEKFHELHLNEIPGYEELFTAELLLP